QWARVLFPLSWLVAFLQLFTTEYFSALEFARPVILWMLLSGKYENRWQTVRRVAVLYLPYFVITVFYFWCRLIYFPVIFQTTSRIGEINSTIGGLQGSLVSTLLDLINRGAKDLIYSVFQVWMNALLDFQGFTFESRVAWFAFGMGILLTLAFAFFYDVHEGEPAENSSPASVFILGIILYLLGAIPVWMIGKDISSGGWADRFALAPMLGACLMVLALLLWFIRPAGQKLILGFLMVFSIAAQIWVVNEYRLDWRTQLEYYWQLYWRVPALKPGTSVIALEQPSLTVTHYADVGYAINVLYHYQTEDGTLPYWMYTRPGHFDYRPDMSYRKALRNLEFNGNTSNAIAVLHQQKDSCLRVLDSVYMYDPLLSDGRDILMAVANPSQIVTDPSTPPPDPDIFGPEPKRDWCYYFERADLARQMMDWDTVLALYREAQKNGFKPGLGSEYLPFIEAYAQTGDWQKAYELTRAAQKTNAGLKKILCTNWSRLGQLPSADMGVIQEARQTLSCDS
ncbi:MAG: hypothetical protein ACM3PS_12285, partial [Syntrophothermus sp.]